MPRKEWTPEERAELNEKFRRHAAAFKLLEQRVKAVGERACEQARKFVEAMQGRGSRA